MNTVPLDGGHYPFLARLLHRIALHPLVGQSLIQYQTRKLAPEVESAIYVTGLARSGTTALLRSLYQTGNFACLRYADMPFVLAPTLSHALFHRNFHLKKQLPRMQRAHKDGIYIGMEDPEGFDEVFWGTVRRWKYVVPSGLRPYTPSKEEIRLYLKWRATITADLGFQRYLAKNNNMILRLPRCALDMPRSKFLILVRHPLNHAASLLKTHETFKRASGFALEYMKLLGHYEFGPNHKPFLFSHLDLHPRFSPDSINYWIERWIQYYKTALRIAPQVKNIRFVIYERLSEKADVIAEYSGANQSLSGLAPKEGGYDVDQLSPDRNLLNQALLIYHEIGSSPSCL